METDLSSFDHARINCFLTADLYSVILYYFSLDMMEGAASELCHRLCCASKEHVDVSPLRSETSLMAKLTPMLSVFATPIHQSLPFHHCTYGGLG